MRHGESTANIEGIIVSDPSIGTVKYGLSPLGRQQVEKAAESFEGELNKIVICASDFQRTRETSEILKTKWNRPEIIFTPKLRERFFGIYEGEQNGNYEKIWKMDINGEDLSAHSIESPEHVAERVEDFISELEERFDGKTIFLISHGDCLQILQAVKLDLPPRKHRSVPHLNLTEIREVTWPTAP